MVLVGFATLLVGLFLLLRGCFWQDDSSSQCSEGTLIQNAGYSVVNGQVLPLEGIITSAYGARENPITGQAEVHTGVDIAAAEDTPILAVMDGAVSQAGYDEEKGNYVQITHPNQVETRYYHCNSLSVKAGDQVTQGQEIAKVGTSGNSTGYHLHFELWVNGQHKNPATWKEYWTDGVSTGGGADTGLLLLSVDAGPLFAPRPVSAGPNFDLLHALS